MTAVQRPTVADHDGHTINVGPVTVGELLPKPVADLDLDGIERAARWDNAGRPGTRWVAAITDLVAEVRRLRAVEVEVDRLRKMRDATVRLLDDEMAGWRELTDDPDIAIIAAASEEADRG